MKILKLLTILMLIPSLCFGEASRDFDEINDQISNSNVPSLGTTDAFLSCWVNLDSISESGAFIKVGTTGNGYGLGVGGSTFDDAGNNLIGLYEAVAWKDTNTNIGTGWHHVALRVDNNDDVTLHLDGISQAGFVAAAPIAPTSGTNTIGGYTGSGSENRFVDASIAYCAIYDTQGDASAPGSVVLPFTSQIMWLPESNPVSIQALWPLWGASTEQDLSGNGRTGTVTETTILQDGPPIGFGSFLPL